MKRVIPFLFLLVPLTALLFFFYMSFFNAAYDHPGKSVYVTRCASCHGDSGEGIRRLVPPIKDADYAKENYQYIPCLILKGMNGKVVVNGKEYDQPMYPLTLSAVEIANLMNYMSEEFMNKNGNFTSDSVEAVLKKCK